MFRTSRLRALRVLVPAVMFAGAGAIPLEPGAAHAAVGPRLTERCFPSRNTNQVSCWTWGNSFAGGEWVHVTYHVTFLTMPKINGRRPTTTFTRTVKTNSSGTFTRTPRVTVSTVKTHSTFEIAVSAIGAQKDRGTTSLAEIGT